MHVGHPAVRRDRLDAQRRIGVVRRDQFGEVAAGPGPPVLDESGAVEMDAQGSAVGHVALTGQVLAEPGSRVGLGSPRSRASV